MGLTTSKTTPMAITYAMKRKKITYFASYAKYKNKLFQKAAKLVDRV